MRVAYITCIRNEERLIFNNLIYYYNIGIRDFYIMFNNSNGPTMEEIEKFRLLKNDVFIKTYEDKRIAYKQPERFTMMSNEAFNDGCNWILPVDADEIVVLRKHKNIQDYLSEFNKHEYGYINCRWIDYHPGPDVKEIKNYFTDWQYREINPRKASKIIVKWNPIMCYGDGHHLLTKGRNKICESIVTYYAHFPNRSLEQIKDKILTIGKAFVEHFGIESERAQVKAYRQILRAGNQWYVDKWDEIIKNRNLVEKIYDPINRDLFIA